MIRAGEGAKHLSEMLHAAVIAVRYQEVGDVRLLSPDQVEKSLSDNGRSDAAQLKARLLHFAFDIALGDLVVTPNARHREVWFATVAGDYRYENPSLVPGYLHVRDVTWLGSIDRDTSLDDEHRRQISSRITLHELFDTDWWRLQAASATLSPVRPRRPTARATPSTGSGRGIAAVTRPDRLCVGCGFTLRAVQFDGDAEMCKQCLKERL
jgi:predicted Mrr-cat superfamily restriction endonuclease